MEQMVDSEVVAVDGSLIDRLVPRRIDQDALTDAAWLVVVS